MRAKGVERQDFRDTVELVFLLPFYENSHVDVDEKELLDRYSRQVFRLLRDNKDSLPLTGTTNSGNSFTVAYLEECCEFSEKLIFLESDPATNSEGILLLESKNNIPSIEWGYEGPKIKGAKDLLLDLGLVIIKAFGNISSK